MPIQRVKNRITELKVWRDFWRECVDEAHSVVENWNVKPIKLKQYEEEGALKPGGANEITTIQVTHRAIVNMAMKQANECQREIDHLRKKYDLENNYLEENADWYYDQAYDPDWFLS